MASHALALYTASNSTYDLEGVPLSIYLVLESTFAREEARFITKAPLTIMPPPSYTMSGGSSLKSMACSKAPQGGAKEKKMAPTRPTTGALVLKRKASDISGTSKCPIVTPSGNTVSCASSSFYTARPSLSYTIVGMQKPKGWYGKALIHKPAKKPVSEPAPSSKESESSGAPLRIKRFSKLSPI
jgi:hypothetical protein